LLPHRSQPAVSAPLGPALFLAHARPGEGSGQRLRARERAGSAPPRAEQGNTIATPSGCPLTVPARGRSSDSRGGRGRRPLAASQRKLDRSQQSASAHPRRCSRTERRHDGHRARHDRHLNSPPAASQDLVIESTPVHSGMRRPVDGAARVGSGGLTTPASRRRQHGQGDVRINRCRGVCVRVFNVPEQSQL